MCYFSYAILRKPGANFHQGLTTSELGAPDYALMLQQHETYASTLQRLGLQTTILPPLDTYPDAYFVEDTAVVVPEIAVISNPGAKARNGEQLAMAPVLEKYRSRRFITAPGTLDGGDVLLFDKKVFIGLSDRTNETGARQLCDFLHPLGYACQLVAVEAGLHLKSSIAYVGHSTLLLTEELAQKSCFAPFKKLLLDADESYAGNVLLINGHLLIPHGFPKTRKKLQSLGQPIVELDMSEARKMDGGLSCLSLRF